MSESVEFLDLDDVIDLATRLLGDPPPIRDIGLLGSAVARPRTSAFGEDAYPDLWTKAAALLQSVVKNHALVDGNKRLGWLSTAVFLEINGIEISSADNESVYQLVIEVAVAQASVDEIAGDSGISSLDSPPDCPDSRPPLESVGRGGTKSDDARHNGRVDRCPTPTGVPSVAQNRP